MSSYQNTTFRFSELNVKEIETILKENNIGLTPDEVLKIEKEILKQPPTLSELIAFSIQGSEHCSYRSSRKYLSLLPTDGPNVIQGPKEDAGIVEIAKDKKDRYGIVMAHESHNHPSQIVPFEGAATGVGGIVRDVICMGAKVIGTADPLRFGDIKNNKSRWIADGVVNGISSYGNPIGVPNLGGDVYFNKSYDDNCLVNVVALGIIKESEIIHSCAPKNSVGYKMILVGKPTDNSGFGGASFASFELDDEEKEKNKGAVQEPNAFLKRHLLESTYDLFKIIKEKKLFQKVGFKDLGAGGIICVTSEMAESAGYGAEVNIEKVHAGMQDLPPYVILCAETQERFLWIADEDVADLIVDHYNNKWDLPKVSKGAKASVIGKVTDGNYVVKYKGTTIIDIEPKSLCGGLRYNREIKDEEELNKAEKIILLTENLNTFFKKILSHENVACRVSIFEQYDKQVQGNTIIESGQADATLIAPLLDMDCDESIKKVGMALSVDANPRYGLISAYWQALNAVVESMRNVAAVGAYPIALTDCLNYGNPEKPEEMSKFVEGVKGIADACNNIHLKEHKKSATPIVSGNVSLYNQTKIGGITPSAIIACVGKIKDYSKAITMRLKKPDNIIYLIGARKNELGGSVYYELLEELGANVPRPEFNIVEQEVYAVTDAIENNLVLSCHDISDGGLATALAEMCFDLPTMSDESKKIGLYIELSNLSKKSKKDERFCVFNEGAEFCMFKKDTSQYLDKEDVIIDLFSETGGFVLEVDSKVEKEFEKFIKNYKKVELFKIGKTTSQPKFIIKNDGEGVIDLDIFDIEKVWLDGLRDKM